MRSSAESCHDRRSSAASNSYGVLTRLDGNRTAMLIDYIDQRRAAERQAHEIGAHTRPEVQALSSE